MRALRTSAFILATVVAPAQLLAMNMPVYDLNSKVYLSTDIVIVQIATGETKSRIATVQETLFGNLPVGTRLDQIDGYLSYFAKISSGDQVILFLDSRPRKLDSIYKAFERVPYALVPSGVELVDPFGHVHSYYQPRNPGGYFPAGYSWFNSDKPLTEDDARKFPTLSEEKQKIDKAIRSVAPARTILGRESTSEDLPRLLHFLDTTSSDRSDCAIRTSRAIREDAIQQIRRRNEPDLLLRAEAVAGETERLTSAEGFLEPAEGANLSESARKNFRQQRAVFLLNALADKRRPLETRRTALDFLLFASAYGHPYSGVAKALPIDAPVLVSIASRIVEVSRSIFSDQDDDAVLRGMCLQFLDMGEATNLALTKAAYKTAKSDALRFEIEDFLLNKSDELFSEFEPPLDYAASIVGVVPRSGCAPTEWPDPLFFGFNRERRSQSEAGQPGIKAQHFTVLVDSTTGRTFDVEATRSYGNQGQFAVENLEEIPAGDYLIETQFRRNETLIGNGYGLRVGVIEEGGRKKIVLDSEASRERPRLALF
jgi:hypothetical protein